MRSVYACMCTDKSSSCGCLTKYVQMYVYDTRVLCMYVCICVYVYRQIEFVCVS